MLRPSSRPPARGWRRGVYAATRGSVNLGPGAAELHEIDLLGRVRTPVRGGIVEIGIRLSLLEELHQDPDRFPAWARIIDQIVTDISARSGGDGEGAGDSPGPPGGPPGGPPRPRE